MDATAAEEEDVSARLASATAAVRESDAQAAWGHSWRELVDSHAVAEAAAARWLPTAAEDAGAAGQDSIAALPAKEDVECAAALAAEEAAAEAAVAAWALGGRGGGGGGGSG